ncbi:MAG TPA: NUDIX domain-containing protein [Streptosporangiaceae bacterium]|nr:NUDIX domain-containing protein [Streptosporangiaceae bacterium]
MSLHEDAVRVLTRWPAPDDGQDRLREEFIDHLAAHADGMWRECAPGHITASTAVLDATGARVLLTLHAKFQAWVQLGGHCEPDDATLAAAALREATEESGIAGLTLLDEPVRLDRHYVPCQGGTYHLDVQYVAIAPDGAREQVSAESVELRWFGVDALPAEADAALRRLVASAAALA